MKFFIIAGICLSVNLCFCVKMVGAHPQGIENPDPPAPVPELVQTFDVVSRLVAANNLGNFPWRSVLWDSPQTEERERREYYALPIYSIISQRLSADTNALACSMAVELTRSMPDQVEKYNRALQYFEQTNPSGLFGRDLLYRTELSADEKKALQSLRELNYKLFVEADKNAVVYMARAGFDPRGCINYLQVFQEFDPLNKIGAMSRLKVFQAGIRQVPNLKSEGESNLARNKNLKWVFPRFGGYFTLQTE